MAIPREHLLLIIEYELMNEIRKGLDRITLTQLPI